MRVLVASVAWPNTVGWPWPLSVAQQLADAARAWYLAGSYGALDPQMTVAPWIRTNIDDTADCGVGWSWPERCAAQLTALGFAPEQYDRVVYVTPRSAGCGPKGHNYVGRTRWCWLNCGDVPGFLTHAMIHEFGHSLGLEHSMLLRTGERIGNTLTFPAPADEATAWNAIDALGDFSTSMGQQAYLANFSAPEKEYLRWIVPALYAGGDETYTLTPMSVAGGLHAVKIVLPTRTYWVEYRQAIGADASLPASALGIQIRVAGAWAILPQALIDAHPESQASIDCGFAIGDRFIDGPITIDVIGPGAIHVSTGQVAPPVVVVQTTGNTQMIIDDFKAKAAALVLGQITPAQLNALDAARALIVPDAGVVAGGITCPPAASVPDVAGNVWTVTPPNLFKNGVKFVGDTKAVNVTGAALKAQAIDGKWWIQTGPGSNDWAISTAP